MTNTPHPIEKIVEGYAARKAYASGLGAGEYEAFMQEPDVLALRKSLTTFESQIRETTAKEVEGMEKGIKWMQEGSNKNRKGYTDGYNQALTNAASLIRKATGN